VSYYNRKQTHSSILHAMCDEQLMIRDVNFGWPGSVADSTIYNTSQLKHLLGSMNNAMVLGDSAYQLSSSVLTPFPQSYTTAQHIRYNTKHAAGRVYIERCFALLKNRWRILKCLTIEWSETAIKAVGCCCILHNMCIANDISADDIDVDERIKLCHLLIMTLTLIGLLLFD